MNNKLSERKNNSELIKNPIQMITIKNQMNRDFYMKYK